MCSHVFESIIGNSLDTFFFDPGLRFVKYQNSFHFPFSTQLRFVVVKCFKDENLKYLKLHGHAMKISTLLVKTRYTLHLQLYTEMPARLDLL